MQKVALFATVAVLAYAVQARAEKLRLEITGAY